VDEGQRRGARGHHCVRQEPGPDWAQVVTDGKDLVVIVEWSDADTFNTFFAGATRMGEFLNGAGIVGEPDVTVLDALDVPGTF